MPARYASAQLMLDGVVTDLSPEGCFFRSDLLDGRGERARLLLELPIAPVPLRLVGEVRWVSDAAHAGGMGLKLIDVSTHDRQLIEGLLGASSPVAVESPAH